MATRFELSWLVAVFLVTACGSEPSRRNGLPSAMQPGPDTAAAQAWAEGSRLCEPCREHEDCASNVEPDALCMDYGAGGKFCGLTCLDEGDNCPTAPNSAQADKNVCTDDACVANQGCVHTYNTAPCNDGNQCTVNEQCNGVGQCVGTWMKCADAFDCTVDFCEPDQGCLFVAAEGLECNDGDPCTVQDACTAQGQCVGQASCE